jgi:glutamyl-tRNA synthetase
VQGAVTVANSDLDDLIMVRADGTPTYMLSVVVDDHDMAVTHAIRGDDHLTNAFRQTQIFQAMNWQPPVYAHIPLIHGPDGTKLSKRHGALGIEAYREMGYLPEAMLNYLCRLGWSHGDDEFFSMDDAASWFEIGDINKGASRIDFDKLTNLNAKYIDEAPTERLLDLIAPGIEEKTGKPLNNEARGRLSEGMNSLKKRAQKIPELVDNSLFYCLDRPLDYSEKAAKMLDDVGRSRLSILLPKLAAADHWTQDVLEKLVKSHTEDTGEKLGEIAQPLRAALTGTTVSPGIFEVAAVLGKDETVSRIEEAIAHT